MLPAKLKPLLLVLVCALCFMLQPIECLFKLVKKKKFMEGFLVGFLVGNEYAAHKGPPKGPGGYPGPMPHYAPMGKPMEFAGEGLSHGHSYLDHYSFMPKKSDRSYRIRRRKAKKRRSKARIKKIVKLPVYVQKSN